MEKLYYSPCDFVGSSDTAAIQAAVDAAVATGIRVVVIPKKADGSAWHLEETITFDGNITIFLDGSTIQTDRVAFMNSNALDMTTKALGGEQYQIYIVGREKATIVSDYDVPQIYLSNVRGYQIAGITFRGGAGVKLNFARHGKVQNLKFRGSTYGLRLSEGCNNNIIEDICAVTENEAVYFQGVESPMFGRGLEMAETIVSRVGARTAGAPAVKICTGPCETYNLIIRDITSLTEGATALQLGAPEDTQNMVEISVRGISSQGAAVKTCGICDGLYIANAHGALELDTENVRLFVDETQEAPVVTPQFPEAAVPAAYITPNDPAYYGETDAETLQNAANAAAAQGAMLLIPRWNARTESTIWNIEKAVKLPSNTTIGLLGTHLRQADFCYDNLFAAEDSENITILGIGDAIIDGGLHNQLKMRNAEKYGMNIRVNATLRFRNVKNLVIENVQMKWTRWYSVYCEFCQDVRLSNIDFEDHPVLPDLGGIRVHSGCSNFLIENLTGTVGDDLVHIEALEGDGVCGDRSVDIHSIHARNLNVNRSSRLVTRILCHDGRKIRNVVVEAVLDPSLPEDKRVPWTSVAVGTIQLSTTRLCECDELQDILVRDIHSRASSVLELGGNSSNVTLINAHGFGSVDRVLSSRLWSNPKNLKGSALFFRCIQGSPYMRGTATSTITDPKKYRGSTAILKNCKATDILLENIFVEKCGTGIVMSGGCSIEIKNLNIGELGRNLTSCDADSTLIIDGEVQPCVAK